jgi:hypothetical protein
MFDSQMPGEAAASSILGSSGYPGASAEPLPFTTYPSFSPSLVWIPASRLFPQICQDPVQKTKVITQHSPPLTPLYPQRYLACLFSQSDILNLWSQKRNSLVPARLFCFGEESTYRWVRPQLCSHACPVRWRSVLRPSRLCYKHGRLCHTHGLVCYKHGRVTTVLDSNT